MVKMKLLLLPLLLVTLTSAQMTPEEWACSQGTLEYLCENYEICSKYGLISEEAKNTICGGRGDPVQDADLSTSSRAPFRDLESSSTSPDIDGAERDMPPSVSTSPLVRWYSSDDSTTDNRILTGSITPESSRTFGQFTDVFSSDGSRNTDMLTSSEGASTRPPTTDVADFITTSDQSLRSEEIFTSNNRITTDAYTNDNRVVTDEITTEWFPSTPESTRDYQTITGRNTRNTDMITGSPLSTEDGRASETLYTTEFATSAKASGEPVNVRVEGKAPVFVSVPRNITVPPGGSGTFHCNATAIPTPQMTITKKDQVIEPDLSNFKGATSSSLSQHTSNAITISNVDKPNEGWYTCQAVNKYGVIRSDAYLHIKDLCEGVVCPGGMKYCQGKYEEGEGHECVCPQYCPINEFYARDEVCSNYCETYGNECQMKSAGCYQDQYGVEVMHKGRCGDIEEPVIEENEDQYGVLEMFEGEEIVMECNARGIPEPQIKWYKGNELVAEGNELSISASEADTGEYFCEAVNCMRNKVSKRMAMVFVTTATSSPMLTSTPYVQPGNLEMPDPARSTCAVFGDPHFLTYDQRAYTYMGTCDNVLAMDCEMGRWFVYGRMRPCGKSDGSCLETVTAYVDTEVLELQRGWLVNRNGGKVVPKNHIGEEIVVEGRFNNFTLLFDGSILELSAVLSRTPNAVGGYDEEKLVIYWDGYVSAHIQTPQSTRTCGMCGNNDGNPDNDMIMRRRGMTDDPVEFGNSWMIDPRNRCSDPEPRKTPEEVCGDDYEATRAECERIFNIESFRTCRLYHETTEWIESCIYDQCEGLMQREELPPKCVVANAYATRCKKDFWYPGSTIPVKDKNVDGWEEEADCPDSEERLQPTLDTGCPQPSLEEELAGDFK